MHSRGSVTAELAVVLPAVTALLALLLLSVSAGMLQLRLEDGARAGARALARGDSSSQVLEIVARVAGNRVAVSLGQQGGYATVTVEGRVDGALSGLVPWPQSASASARSESSVATTSLPAMQPSPALWRWARGPGCPLPTDRCTGAAGYEAGYQGKNSDG